PEIPPDGALSPAKTLPDDRSEAQDRLLPDREPRRPVGASTRLEVQPRRQLEVLAYRVDWPAAQLGEHVGANEHPVAPELPGTADVRERPALAFAATRPTIDAALYAGGRDRGARGLARPVRRTIVDDDNLGRPAAQATEVGDHRPDDARLVAGRDQDDDD